jgi:protein-S-isoprenylcysteine O-methyltransferase Ste14
MLLSGGVALRLRIDMNALELKIPPVAQVLIAAAGMWLTSRYAPSLSVTIPARVFLAVFVVGFGIFVAVPAVKAFRSADTTVDPFSPDKVSKLVVAGVYRFSRNPMYLGLLCLLVAWATWLSNLVAFAWLVAFVLCMNRLQILPEEKALTDQFGDEYRAYMASVRRWI